MTAGGPIVVVLDGRKAVGERGGTTLLARAASVATAAGVPLVAIVLDADGDGFDPAALRAPGLAAVHHIAHPALGAGDPEVAARACWSVCTSATPSAVLFDDGPQERAAAAWLAVRHAAALLTGVTDLALDGGRVTAARRAYQGAVTEYLETEAPVVATLEAVQAGSAPIDHGEGPAASDGAAIGEPPSVVASDGGLGDFDARVRLVEAAGAVGDTGAAGPSLRAARAIVAVGGGVQTAEQFEHANELAALLGAVVGGSKAGIDRGWITAAQKIGLTGITVSPDVYLALGISGASQHMAGCNRSGTIVAVNQDRRAPIFRHAHIGVVGDLADLLPALVAEAAARRAAGHGGAEGGS